MYGTFTVFFFNTHYISTFVILCDFKFLRGRQIELNYYDDNLFPIQPIIFYFTLMFFSNHHVDWYHLSLNFLPARFYFFYLFFFVLFFWFFCLNFCLNFFFILDCSLNHCWIKMLFHSLLLRQDSYFSIPLMSFQYP